LQWNGFRVAVSSARPQLQNATSWRANSVGPRWWPYPQPNARHVERPAIRRSCGSPDQGDGLLEAYSAPSYVQKGACFSSRTGSSAIVFGAEDVTSTRRHPVRKATPADEREGPKKEKAQVRSGPRRGRSLLLPSASAAATRASASVSVTQPCRRCPCPSPPSGRRSGTCRACSVGGSDNCRWTRSSCS
jgi:hypothetical protein